MNEKTNISVETNNIKMNSTINTVQNLRNSENMIFRGGV